MNNRMLLSEYDCFWIMVELKNQLHSICFSINIEPFYKLHKNGDFEIGIRGSNSTVIIPFETVSSNLENSDYIRNMCKSAILSIIKQEAKEKRNGSK